MKTAGEQIALRRKALGLTQLDLATRANVHFSHVSLIELGRRQPSLKVLIRLVKGLGGRVLLQWNV